MINLEIKVAVSNFEEIKNEVIKIGAQDRGVLYQTDTYFMIGKRRLKLREEKDKNYLVFYIRPDNLNSKYSKYYIVNIPLFFLEIIKFILKFIFGIKVVVNKKRNLFTYNNTRIHLDEVENLGFYIELETVFMNGLNDNDLNNEHNFIKEALGLNNLKLVKESYSDLMF